MTEPRLRTAFALTEPRRSSQVAEVLRVADELERLASRLQTLISDEVLCSRLVELAVELRLKNPTSDDDHL